MRPLLGEFARRWGNFLIRRRFQGIRRFQGLVRRWSFFNRLLSVYYHFFLNIRCVLSLNFLIIVSP
jgi:hypothetical protein